jgi:TetR/AcrR family transcriptional regulator, transcriptional repressor for nem operon
MVYIMVSREKTEQVRQQIIVAIDNLLYHRGFNLMSFSDIAEASAVPRGNIYYYFKTKDEVLEAVIEYRIAQMQLMLEDWNTNIKTPLKRLKRYAKIPLNEIDNITRFGCPIGSLNTELGKSQHDLQQVTRKQYDAFLDWLKSQFREMVPEKNAHNLAMHLLVLTQGLAVIAQSYDDKKLVRREMKTIESWLESLL